MPDLDIDITSDLDGSANEGYLGDNAPSSARGATPAHGDAVNPNQVDNAPVADTGDKADDKKAPASLRDQLSSAFKGEDGKPAEQANAPSADAPPALTKDADGKYRNADGTFASAEQVAAFENTLAAPEPGTAADQRAQATPPEYTANMTPAEAEQFKALPAELREYVGRTMEALNTRGKLYSEYDMIEQHIIGPRREAWAGNGLTPAVAMNQLLALSDFATRDPGQFVLYFAEQNKLDLDALLDAHEAAQSADPTVRALQGQVQHLSSTLQGYQQHQQQTVQQQNLALVENFAQEKDEAGSLKRPYITEVADEWAAQITTLQRTNPQLAPADLLQKAYENACWANPAVRTKMQSQATEAQRREAARRAEVAKAAGSSVSGAPAGGRDTAANSSGKTLREQLQEQFAAARA